MTTATRIYLATINGKPRLVRAAHPSNVLMHVARDTVKVNVATQDELVKHLGAGVKVEDIGPEQQPLAAE